MFNKFDRLLEKKGKKVSDVEQRAKHDVLAGLQNDASDVMGDKLDGLKKVSVAAPNKEGLEHGLDKAKQLLGHMPEDEESNEDPKEEADESPEQEAQEEHDEPTTVEEIDEKIQLLLQLKKELEHKQGN